MRSNTWRSVSGVCPARARPPGRLGNALPGATCPEPARGYRPDKDTRGVSCPNRPAPRLETTPVPSASLAIAFRTRRARLQLEAGRSLRTWKPWSSPEPVLTLAPDEHRACESDRQLRSTRCARAAPRRDAQVHAREHKAQSAGTTRGCRVSRVCPVGLRLTPPDRPPLRDTHHGMQQRGGAACHA
jgi:hypothetical protein